MVLDLDVDVPAVVLGEGKGLLKGGDCLLYTSRGVTPMSRLKKREKWLWSAKPVWSATSIIGTFRSSSFRALAMRMVSRYRYGEMPFCLVNERRR